MWAFILIYCCMALLGVLGFGTVYKYEKNRGKNGNDV